MSFLEFLLIKKKTFVINNGNLKKIIFWKNLKKKTSSSYTVIEK